MNLLVVSNLYYPEVVGGYELGAYYVVEVLKTRGHAVTVLTAAPSGDRVPSEPGIERRLRITPAYDPDYLGPLDGVERDRALRRAYLYDPRNVEAFVAACGRSQPPLAYFWNLAGLGSLGLMGAAHALGIPTVIHLMDYYPETIGELLAHLRPQWAAQYQAFMGRAFRPTLICCSRTVRTILEGAGLGCPSHVVYNWADVARIPPKTDYDITPRELRVAYVGQFQRAKGLHLALDAILALPPAYRTRVRFDLIGRGSEEEWRLLRPRLEVPELRGRVTVRGPLSHGAMLETYREYDVLVFVTHPREPFGFVGAEAMAAGLVVIMGHVGGISEIGVDGVNCVKVEHTAGSLAAALKLLMDEPGRLERIGRQARTAVSTNYDVKNAVDAIETILCASGANRARAVEPRDYERVLSLNAAFERIAPHITPTLDERIVRHEARSPLTRKIITSLRGADLFVQSRLSRTHPHWLAYYLRLRRLAQRVLRG